MFKYTDEMAINDLMGIINTLKDRKLTDDESNLLYSLVIRFFENNNNIIFEKINDKYIIEILIKKRGWIKNSQQLLKNIIEKIDNVEKITLLLEINPSLVKYIKKSFFINLYNDEKNFESVVVTLNDNNIILKLLEQSFNKEVLRYLNHSQQLILLKYAKKFYNSNNQKEKFDILMEKYLLCQKIHTNIFLNESLQLASELNISNEFDEEFNQLISKFIEISYQNPNYRILNNLYIKSFYIIYNKNSELAKISLKTLINSLKNGTLKPEILFSYSYYSKINKGDQLLESSLYDEINRCIAIKEFNGIYTIIHETGHMFHHLLDSLQIPNDEFGNFMNKFINTNVDEKIRLFANEYLEIKKNIKNMIETKIKDNNCNQLFNDFNFNKAISILDIPYEIKEFIILNTGIESQNIYTLKAKKKIIDIFVNIYISHYYPWLDLISDILDAIYEGDIYDNLSLPGHGIDYYKDNDENRFAEIFANYYAIKCLSPNKMELLKDILGVEFIEYMESYIQKIFNMSDNISIDERKNKI